jgi:hypothetical protein
MLKRSSKSSFMPDAYVFPGGVLSPADLRHVTIEASKLFEIRFIYLSTSFIT